MSVEVNLFNDIAFSWLFLFGSEEEEEGLFLLLLLIAWIYGGSSTQRWLLLEATELEGDRTYLDRGVWWLGEKMKLQIQKNSPNAKIGIVDIAE